MPHRSELLRIAVKEVHRIDAERDYVRLHVATPGEEANAGADGASPAGRTYLLLQTIAGLEARLDPDRFIRIHRSTILRRDNIRGLRHDGLGVWSAELMKGVAAPRGCERGAASAPLIFDDSGHLFRGTGSRFGHAFLSVAAEPSVGADI